MRPELVVRAPVVGMRLVSVFRELAHESLVVVCDDELLAPTTHGSHGRGLYVRAARATTGADAGVAGMVRGARAARA